ncbi:MAG: outer membrane protein assembly factor BamD [Planctomycetes bacterium]|nr:outer membrane protein assembly factor BamD [Planctomycetota bacterium]
MKPLAAVILASFFLPLQMVQAKWIWSPTTGFYNPKYAIKGTAEEQFNYAMDVFQDKDYRRARKIFQRLIQFFPDSKHCAEAQFMIAECYFMAEDYYAAFKAYQTLVKEYPKHERIQDVIAKEYRIGSLLCHGVKRKWFGLRVGAADKGIECLEDVIKLDGWDDLADDSLFEIGLCQYRHREYDEAEKTFARFLQDYPSSEFASQAQYLKAMSSYDQVQGPEYDPTFARKAKKDFTVLKQDFPESTVSQDAEQKMNQMEQESARKEYETALFYLKNRKFEAVRMYFQSLARTFPETSYGSKARKLVEALNSLETRQP